MSSKKGGTSSPPASTLLLEEYFESGDERFINELFASQAEKKLKSFGERWYKDSRPFARQMLVRYVEDGCDRPHHRPLVKKLFKLAEAAGDDTLMGAFMVAFDHLVTRKLVEVEIWDWTARQTQKVHQLRFDPSMPSSRASASKKNRFSRATRQYLARRAFRYFRRIGRKDEKRYGKTIRAAIARYSDEHLSTPAQLLDAWGLLHVLYWGSKVVERKPRGAVLRPGSSLADLVPSPIYAGAWVDCFDEVLTLAEIAQSRTVRVFAISLLEQNHRGDLAKLPFARLRALLKSPHEEIQTLAAKLLTEAKGLDALSLTEWLELLKIDNPFALPLLVELVRKHVSPARLTLADCVDLALARTAPVADLGLAWAMEKNLRTEIELRALLRLGNAPAPKVRDTAAAWIAELLRDSPHARPEHLRELIDSKFADTRQKAIALLEKDARYRESTELWGALSESPYDDARTYLVKHLEEREKALLPGDLTRVWATSLLAVHRGGRAKRLVVKQIADRIVARPGDADQLLPLLGVALRSVRSPERRAGLAALSSAAFRAPALRASIRAKLPELVLFEEDAVCR